MPPLSRRAMVGGTVAMGGMSAPFAAPLAAPFAAPFGTPLAAPATARDAPLKIGLMLPFSGLYAAIGESIAAAFDLRVRELGGKMGGRVVELLRVDDESDPVKASSNVNRLLGPEQVEALVGTVQSSVVTAMVRAARERAVPLIIPGAGDVGVTREACAPSVFRSSFSNWQPAFALGKAMAAAGVRKAAWVTWNDAAGKESGAGFSDGLKASGAELTRMLTLPFRETNFDPLLARLPDLGVDAVGALFDGDGAIEFVRRYAASRPRDKLPLYGAGFLTEGVLKRQGPAAEGLRTALHYGDGIDNPKNLAFRAAFRSFANREADVYAVQGYDAAQMLAIGLDATQGNAAAIADFAAAIRAARIDSPRGVFTLSASHNPVQTIWLREARNGENRVIAAAAEALADPGAGCAMT